MHAVVLDRIKHQRSTKAPAHMLSKVLAVAMMILYGELALMSVRRSQERTRDVKLTS